MSDFLNLFQGLDTLFESGAVIAGGRVFLILLGALLVYLGRKGVLEPLLMIPMGIGMVAVNAGVLHFAPDRMGTLFVDPLITDYGQLMDTLQIDCFQPIYTFTFSNGLIACFVFMGIGSILDIGYMLARPLQSMILALAAELGTVAVFPIGVALGLPEGKAASVAMIGGADGPMVLYTSLTLAKDVFVPITVIAYLYLGLTYGGYPYLAKLMIPKRLRALPAMPEKGPKAKSSPMSRLAFAVVGCGLLCLLFPVAAPLFLSLFIGVACKEAGLTPIVDFMSGPLLYGSTFILGLLLGVLCEARVLLDPQILPLLLLGILSLLLSGVGGILGGYLLYFMTGRKYNPLIGLAGVSCVPTCAKLAQKEAMKANPRAIILPQALGANICGVITSAILCGIYTTLIQ